MIQPRWPWIANLQIWFSFYYLPMHVKSAVLLSNAQCPTWKFPFKKKVLRISNLDLTFRLWWLPIVNDSVTSNKVKIRLCDDGSFEKKAAKMSNLKSSILGSPESSDISFPSTKHQRIPTAVPPWGVKSHWDRGNAQPAYKNSKAKQAHVSKFEQ